MLNLQSERKVVWWQVNRGKQQDEREITVAKVKKTYSLDARVAEQIDEYADAFGMSASAFVSLMVSQIGHVLTIAAIGAEKSDAGKSGEI